MEQVVTICVGGCDYPEDRFYMTQDDVSRMLGDLGENVPTAAMRAARILVLVGFLGFVRENNEGMDAGGLQAIQEMYQADGYGYVSYATIYRDLAEARRWGYFCWLQNGVLMVVKEPKGKGKG